MTETSDGQKMIKITSGVHYITEPIVITEDNLHICGEDGAVLRATCPIGQNVWQSLGDGMYCTEVSKIPDALYLGNRKYRMARYPKYDPDIPIFGGYSADCLSKEKAASWKNPKGGYIHALHKHHWGGFSYKITGKDEKGNLTYTGGWQNNRQMGMHEEYRYVENIFEELTEPGEWYFDEDMKKLYLILVPGDDLSTAEIAVSSGFFVLENRKNITIENIVFERSSRTFMLTREPLLRSDWTIYRGGAVYFKDCQDCEINLCTFRDVGSNAVFVDAGSQRVAVSKCLMENIGASGVCFVGRSDSVRSPLFEYGETHSLAELDLTPGPKSDHYPRNCSVDNCVIRKVGVAEKQATGVEISMAYRISVTNCSIYDTSRAGINISEGTFGGHLIDGCDVFDTVRETGDHGSFNSWGRDRFWHLRDVEKDEVYRYALLDCIEPVTISNNRFRCDRGWDIDLDDGSSNYRIFNNLCLNGGIKLREGFCRQVYNNITVNNSIHLHVWYPNSGDIVRNNLIFTPYKPIRMPETKWGESIDCNYLYNPDAGSSPAAAEELSEMTGDDARSIRVHCRFAAVEKGDYTVLEPALDGFENFMSEFGVKYPPLKALCRQPVFPVLETEESQMLSVYEIHRLTVKNIDTDGEMSAYGTAGHNGVILLSVNEYPKAICKGLQKGDVIVACGETVIHNAEDFSACTDVYQQRLEIIRGQKHLYL